MKGKSNRTIERAGVNAVRTLFEACGHVFQEVSQDNDYGKDAYVDLVDGSKVSGLCVSLQIKSGKKYRRASGYAIPVGEHAEVWRLSSVPIAGIVFDPDSGKLFWESITDVLNRTPEARSISIAVDRELTAETIGTAFKPAFRELSNHHLSSKALLQLCSGSDTLRPAAMWDCFATGRADPRFFIAIRNLIPLFSKESLRHAMGILAYFTPHGDLHFNSENWISHDVYKAVTPYLRWSDKEIYRMLDVHPWRRWQRGDEGQDAFMVVVSDPDVEIKVERVAIKAMRRGNRRVAWAAFYMTIYFAGDDGLSKLKELCEIEPTFCELEHFSETVYILEESGCASMF